MPSAQRARSDCWHPIPPYFVTRSMLQYSICRVGGVLFNAAATTPDHRFSANRSMSRHASLVIAILTTSAGSGIANFGKGFVVEINAKVSPREHWRLPLELTLSLGSHSGSYPASRPTLVLVSPSSSPSALQADKTRRYLVTSLVSFRVVPCRCYVFVSFWFWFWCSQDTRSQQVKIGRRGHVRRMGRASNLGGQC